LTECNLCKGTVLQDCLCFEVRCGFGDQDCHFALLRISLFIRYDRYAL
jgi:hypothetical protein